MPLLSCLSDLILVMGFHWDHLAKLEALHFTEFPPLCGCELSGPPREIKWDLEDRSGGAVIFSHQRSVLGQGLLLLPGVVCVLGELGVDSGPQLPWITSCFSECWSCCMFPWCQLFGQWETNMVHVCSGGFQFACTLSYFTRLPLPAFT